jgi:signal peptidase II
MKRVWLVVLMVVLVVALDAGTKQWALNNLELGRTQPFLPGILQYTLTWNTGGAFGIGRQFKEVMTFLPMAVCAALIYWIYRRETSGAPLSRLEQVGFGLVIGGALGNIADRIVRGRVTDFLEFSFISFPVFNVADALIDVGIAFLLISSLRSDGRKNPAAPNE